MLDRFGDDRHALASFTEGADGWLDPRPMVSAPTNETDHLASIIDFAVANDQMTNGGDARPQWLSRVIVVLLAEQATDPLVRQAAQRLVHQPTASARRAALWRANQRLAGDPAAGRVLSAVQRHLARSECA